MHFVCVVCSSFKGNLHVCTPNCLLVGIYECVHALPGFFFIIILLSMHHLCALLGSYSPPPLMSLKMQIKASRVLKREELSRVCVCVCEGVWGGGTSKQR